MQKCHLLIDKGHRGQYTTYVIAGFDKHQWLRVSPIINSIAGVEQTFTVTPDMLLILVIHGILQFIPNVTSSHVDKFYGRKV